MVLSLIKAHDYLYNKVSKKSQDWLYGGLCTNIYAHLPFSDVPVLSYFFHREGPGQGNLRTVNYALASLNEFDPDNGVWFRASLGTNLRMSMDMGGEGRFSVDTGVSGNVFSPHYFNMNQDHL